MAISNIDPGLQTVLTNVNTVVASEGGTLEFVGLDDGKLTVKYTPGVNEECPECVPDYDLVRMMMQTSISIYAPQVTEIEVE